MGRSLGDKVMDAARHGVRAACPCCPPSLRQTAQHHWRSHLLLLMLHTGSPLCPEVTHPICPSPLSISPASHLLPYCQTFKLPPCLPFFWAWIGTNSVEKFSFPPEIPKSVSSGRDTTHCSPHWAPPQGRCWSLRTQGRPAEARRDSEKLIREIGGASCAQPLTLVFWCWKPHYPPHQWDQTCPCSTTPRSWGAVGVHGHGGLRWNRFPGGFTSALGSSRAVLSQSSSLKEPQNRAVSVVSAGSGTLLCPSSISVWNVLLGGVPVGHRVRGCR